MASEMPNLELHRGLAVVQQGASDSTQENLCFKKIPSVKSNVRLRESRQT